MKTLSLRKFNRAYRLLLIVLLLAAALLIMARKGPAAQEAIQWQTALIYYFPKTFYVRSYGGKCLDFGPPPQVTGAPVYIYGCNGTIAQQVVVEEVNARHEVILRAGNKVIGVKGWGSSASKSVDGPRAEKVAPETVLELQDEKNRNTVFSAGQIFALDGDSLILAANRNLVVKVQNNRGKNRTPLVLGRRELADAEFWTFSATDGSNRRPTGGFVRVSNAFELAVRLWAAKWGTVIEVDPDATIDLKDVPALHIPAGVTIRGNRRGTLQGPELSARNEDNQNSNNPGMLVIDGDYVRITGLRMRGPSRLVEDTAPLAHGIQAFDKYISIIDHNDLSDWTLAAINIVGEDDAKECKLREDSRSRPQNIRVVRNFIHHNQNLEGDGLGYGVAAGNGGYPSIEGNTFLSNIHSIAGDGTARNGYRAWFNLVLSDDPGHGVFNQNHSHDFDMHGTDPSSGTHHTGGGAGDYIEIAGNTFLGTNRPNFNLRGTPCYLAEFHHNVSLRSLEDAIINHGDQSKFIVSGSEQFNTPNPTTRLGVGDFDGDGKDDLFLATGAAWYYAPAANAEWRFLNAQADGIASLLFGDFDADGRTDVFTRHGKDWVVSWGGASKWEKINESEESLNDFAIGDFIGDRRADVFYASGSEWYISDGGVSEFTPLNTSSFRIPDLRFGDFNGDGKTDVFNVGPSDWRVSYSGTSQWTSLRPRLTSSVAGLIVADFNGNGRADVATSSRSGSFWVWRVSWSGTGNWTTLRWATLSLASVAAIGRFDGNASADVLMWHDNYLDIIPAGSAIARRQSRQDMR